MNPLYLMAIALALVWTGCTPLGHDFPASKGAGTPAAAAKGPASALAHAPLSPDELATTDGALALANLDAEIRGLGRAVTQHPSIERMALLAEDLAARGQYLGRLSDYEQAETLADEAVAHFGDAGQAYQMRAKVRAVYHRFADALSDLDRAHALGVPESALAGTRAGVLQALGRYAEALAIRHDASSRKPELAPLGNEASVLAEQGEFEKAEQLFVAAEHNYHDVSPFPLAWLWFQQGSMWEKRGELARARALFEAASARVPGYAHAASHLASLVPAARAIELLQAISQSSDDPEYRAQLGVLLKENGRSALGEAMIAAAGRTYDDLTLRHPPAFADHAARFWLGPGADAAKALTWARAAAEARPTRDSWTLLIDCALSAHDAGAACAGAARAVSQQPVTSALHLLAARAFDDCGQGERANHERELASTAP
jgi:tetratricopeptide (TPR) repeat protein